ncbi:hypothetical protein PROP_01097 [Propionicimonas sp. T2.31MG-18]|uniref:hypothetical protein n=1 Tax=Propionicimonas sp. T2.31MG-18 TaxID=3157620 RepID=UPI0035E5DDCF
MSASDIISGWPQESQEAAQLVVDTYGEPHEATDSYLIWHNVGAWKRIVASKQFWAHQFPAPHIDAVQSFIDYHVPVDKVGELATFDGSVIVDRTAGEVSARCHDEQANNLALNLMHDIVSGAKDVTQARTYYATEFLNARRKQATPYMDTLRVSAGVDTPDPDQRLLSDDDLDKVKAAGSRS